MGYTSEVYLHGSRNFMEELNGYFDFLNEKELAKLAKKFPDESFEDVDCRKEVFSLFEMANERHNFNGEIVYIWRRIKWYADADIAIILLMDFLKNYASPRDFRFGRFGEYEQDVEEYGERSYGYYSVRKEFRCEVNPMFFAEVFHSNK